MIINTRAHARFGLVGNPSDGYYGKTIAVILKNFAAEVTLYETPELEIVAGQEDTPRYVSLADLTEDVALNGYYGGVRLVKATVSRFVRKFLRERKPGELRNFTVRYKTNIPRQVGLAGSSAIITATTRALCRFYDVHVDRQAMPTFVLEVETKELNIAAGLQDRVIQTYEGAVYMDFDRRTVEETGHGRYEPLDTSLLPPLFVAYRTDVAELSTVTHTDLRTRFDMGDATVVDGMAECARLAERARELLLAGKGSEIGELLDRNFDARRSMCEIDPRDLEMIEIGRKYGAHPKFSGSGGAVVGIYPGDEACAAMTAELKELNCEVIRPRS
ncbi:MAG: GHMP kinase [Planctomycetota bacterium]